MKEDGGKLLGTTLLYPFSRRVTGGNMDFDLLRLRPCTLN